MKYILVIVFVFLNSGCTNYSISDVGYTKKQVHLKKELSEFKVVGIDTKKTYNKNEITHALDNYEALHLDNNNRIMVIQSGSEFPDSELIQALSKRWNVSYISGDNRDYEDVNLNKFFRYAAASSGSDYVLTYWGIIETAEKRKVHRSQVSWIPIVGWGLPDKDHIIRMRLKFILMNVKTGNWEAFSSDPVQSQFTSSLINRNDKDQDQIIQLKKKTYSKAVDQLASRFLIKRNAISVAPKL